jgi:hypothetical protein
MRPPWSGPVARPFALQEDAVPALAGRAIRSQVRVPLDDAANGPYLDLLLYAPAHPGPTPCFWA